MIIYLNVYFILNRSVVAYWLIRHELSDIAFRVFCFVVFNSVFNFMSETSDKTLNWPCCGITKSANGVTFDLVG
jgi:hypothetical protein